MVLVVMNVGSTVVVFAAAVVDKTWRLDPNLLAWVMGFAVPVVTAIVAKRLAHPALKAVITAVLAALSGLLATSIAMNGDVSASTYASGMVQAAVAAWAVYYGFWKPTNVAPFLQRKTARFGLGPKAAPLDRAA